MLPFLKWTAAAVFILSFSTAAAQETESYNAQNKFSSGAIYYNRSASLAPLHFNLYGIPPTPNVTEPDLLITLNATSGDTGLKLYCNPGYLAFTDASGSYPGPGFSQWFSELSTTVNQIFISKNDPAYKSPISSNDTDSEVPIVVCSVMNTDANTTTSYTISAALIPGNRTLLQSERDVLGSLYSRCCTAAGSCNTWKAQNNGYVDANAGAVNTDFCNFPNQICSPSSNLYRLDLATFNLSCPWPGDLISQFTQLSTLSIGGNTLITGNTSSVFGTLGNLTNLQFFDISGNTGIKGTIDGGTANFGLCTAVKANLISLKLNSVGLSGTIPSCLYSQGSSLIYLDLTKNSFTGPIKNTIPVGSALQLLHVGYNELTGQLPPSLGNAAHFVDLDATNNMFSGSIPAAIGSIPTLANFVVLNNSLTGPIPDSFGTALNLQGFDAKQNQLTALPAAWTNASYDAVNSSYVSIRVSYNNISGPFPAGLVNATQLTFLVLNVNNFTGQLPANDGMFVSLRAFNASFNQLTGPIPDQWSQTGLFSATPLFLEDGSILLQTFDISNNRLNGSLPSFLANTVVPAWLKPNVRVENNQLTANCSDPRFQYLSTLCAGAISNTPPVVSSVPPTTATVAVLPPPPTAVVSAPAPKTSVTPASKSPASVSSQAADKPVAKSGGLSGGAIAGIVIGVLAAAAIAIFVAFFAFKRRHGEPMMPQLNGGTFGFREGGGEFGRKHSLKKGLTSLSSHNSGFERFQDEPSTVELSPAAPENGKP